MLTDEQLKTITAKVRETYEGELKYLKLEDGTEVIIRPATRAEMNRFDDMTSDPKRRSKAGSVLVRACVLYPSSDAFEQLLEKKPAVVHGIFDRVTELSGAANVAEEKNL